MKKPRKSIETLTHDAAGRKNIPTAEYRSVLRESERNPVRVAYERRDRDLDPQLVWRGKDGKDWADLVVQAPPLYIQEKLHPKALVDDLLRETREREHHRGERMPDLFADFNGIPKGVDKTEFYRHDQNWSNRMILGDSLQVMASLAEREGLRGQVQCIYLDPPYGIKFNSNFQWSTTSRDVKDGKAEHITREPEQVKAFRDTWRDGIHSYLTYLRDRLTVARDLLHESGSIFVQIGDENVHRVRALMDEVFGDEHFVSEIVFQKTGDQPSMHLPNVSDIIVWYAKGKSSLKFRRLYFSKNNSMTAVRDYGKTDENGRSFQATSLTSPRPPGDFPVEFRSKKYRPSGGYWKTGQDGFPRLIRANRILLSGRTIRYKRYLEDFAIQNYTNFWTDTGGTSGKVYVVQTAISVVQRCILMTTDPGDLVLDPTCGSGTTAYVAEQWGRRWITIDTSRVSLALARARIMGARYPYYLLADSPEGQTKEAEISRAVPSSRPTHGDIRHGFVYQRVPHITLKSIANNAEIDVIWARYQEILEPLRKELNELLGVQWEEWEIPRELRGEDGTANGRESTRMEERTKATKQAQPPGEAPAEKNIRVHSRAFAVHQQWWEQRIARQQEIDASIAARADFETLYDKPYEDKKRVRVAGPFTVESISPHRVLGVDEHDELIDPLNQVAEDGGEYALRDFTQMILENLRTAGVQQAHKQDRIAFTALTPWPGDLVCAEGRYIEGDPLPGPLSEEEDRGEEVGHGKRAAIFIGPEFGTVSRPDLVEAAREAGNGEAVARFIDTVVDKLFFTVITVNDELNAFKVLETLNARGVRLSATDLLKNHLFSVISRGGAHETELESLEARWETIVGLLGSESFPEFLRVFWNSRNRLVRKAELFKTLRRTIGDKATAFALIRDLDRQAGVYVALRNPEDELWNDEERDHLRRLSLFNVHQPLAVLLAVFERFAETDRAGFSRFLHAIAVVSFRYNVICSRQGNEQEKVYNAIARSVAAGERPRIATVIAALRPIYPEDEAFKTAFADKELRTTNNRNKKIARHILFEIERRASGRA